MNFAKTDSSRRSSELPRKIIEWAILIVIIIISLYPFLWILQSSIKSETDIYLSPFKLSETIDFENYVQAYTMRGARANLATFFRNSALIGALTVFFSVFIYGLGGYVLARESFPGKSLVIGLCALSLLMPRVALMFPLFLYSHLLGLYDTVIILIIVYTGFMLPLSIFVLRSYVLTIPRSLEDAAYIDGATYMQTFMKIVVPLAQPAIATVGILVFINSWNEFSFALLLTSSNASRTIPVALAYFTSIYGSNIGAMFAGMVIVVSPAIIIFIMFQKKIVSGLAAGSIKQ